MQLKVAQPYLNTSEQTLGQRTLRGEELQLLGAATVFIEDLDDADPLLFLAIVDLAEIEHGVLHDPMALAPAVFHQRPIVVLLAVFESFGAAQEHDSYRA